MHMCACVWLKSSKTDHKILVIAPAYKTNSNTTNNNKNHHREKETQSERNTQSHLMFYCSVAVTRRQHIRRALYARINWIARSAYAFTFLMSCSLFFFSSCSSQKYYACLDISYSIQKNKNNLHIFAVNSMSREKKMLLNVYAFGLVH